MPALSIQNACKRFSSHVALDDFSLDVRNGELLTIVGPSGSGKTTLLRSIAGLEHLDSGSICLSDQTLNGLPPRLRNVAMVFQQPALYPHLRVRDNIAFPLRMRGERQEAIHRRVQETAASLGIDSLLDRRPQQLSGGEAQRVALARALVRQPDCLLLDEPLSNLDAPLRNELRRQLKSLHAAQPITTLLVTHDPEEALSLGDRVAVLQAGRLQQIATPQEIVAERSGDFIAELFSGCTSAPHRAKNPDAEPAA